MGTSASFSGDCLRGAWEPVAHGHSGDDGLGPRTALRQRKGQETHYLIWTGVTHAPSFESDGWLAGAVAQMLGSYSPGSVLWPCDFSLGARGDTKTVVGMD